MVANSGKASFFQFAQDVLKVISSSLVFFLFGLVLVLLVLQEYVWAAIIAIALLLLLGLLIGLSYIYPKAYEWTGIAESAKDISKRRRRTLWDWLGLWIIPFILSAGVIGFTGFQNQANNVFNQKQADIASAQQANDRTIAHLQQQQNIVQSYLDRMSDLLLNHPNIRNKQGDDIRIVARARTLTTLLDLDPGQRAIVVHFLYYGDLIGQPSSQSPYQPIVNLDSADLIGANLDHAQLSGANFQVTNLSSVTLIGANLSAAYLAKVNLKNAKLQQAYLCYTAFIGAPTETSSLYQADLSNAHLRGANLTGANLTQAKLIGANLSSTDTDPNCPLGNPLRAANLTNANLTGANLTDANLRGANLSLATLTGVIWKNTTCPDSTNTDTNGGSCMNHLKV